MVKIRLARHGAKKTPYYHIVVTDSQSPRDGRFIEQIGTYNPRRPMSEARIDRARLEHWVGVGACVTESLQKVIREQARTQGQTPGQAEAQPAASSPSAG